LIHKENIYLLGLVIVIAVYAGIGRLSAIFNLKWSLKPQTTFGVQNEVSTAIFLINLITFVAKIVLREDVIRQV
jgi:hypothetical protein